MTVQASSHATRDALVMAHVTLVRAIAQRLVQRLPSQVELGDLVSAGVLGLIDAAERYRPSTGVPFEAFARRRVQGAMLDSLRGLDWAPRSLRRLRRELDGAIAGLRHTLGREPDEHEIAAAMGMSAAGYARALDQVRTLEIGAIRQLDEDGDGAPAIELCVDPGESAATQLERKELRQRLGEAVACLPAREQQVLSLSYEHELTLAEIGRVLGVSESRVCQIRSQAFARLRSRLRESIGLERTA
jgi:RNA polymerase sigma factor FliA